ncbi:MAG TPA: hypothetical protein VM261_14480 [Kofleriaceae bacterium]|nr:hypothetical protein [Kofleriaceae bacterium]
MRAAVLVLLVFAAACGNDEVIPDAPANPDDAGVVDAPDADPTDAGIDADVRCAACTATQVCVAFHDGVCSSNIRVECQERAASCEGLNCIQDTDCAFHHCREGTDAGVYTCYSCPNDLPAAINCHGP